MTPEMKEKLMLRMFASLEYIELFLVHYQAFIDAGLEAVKAYRALPFEPVGHANYQRAKTDIKLWELKVVPNFVRMHDSAYSAFDKAKQGDLRYVRSLAGAFRGLSRDMDGIREAFMDFIDPEIKQRYFQNLKLARIEGGNIWWTLSNYWNPGEIFKESITGPIDEQELIGYLKPGESI